MNLSHLLSKYSVAYEGFLYFSWLVSRIFRSLNTPRRSRSLSAQQLGSAQSGRLAYYGRVTGEVGTFRARNFGCKFCRNRKCLFFCGRGNPLDVTLQKRTIGLLCPTRPRIK